jgi:CBS domain-containing protein
MNVGTICTHEPKCINPTASLVEAAQQMKLMDVGMIPVCENEKLVGSLTDRDITIRAVAQDLDPRITTVRAVMTPGVIYCFEDQTAEEAAEIMEDKKIRRLPVLNREKRLVGILSLGDLAVRTGQELLVGQVLERVSEPAVPMIRATE